MGEKGPRFFAGLAVLAIVLSLAYVAGLVADWPSWLHGVNWVWVRRVPETSWGRLGLLAGMGLLWLAVLWMVLRTRQEWPRRWTVWLLAWAMLFTPLMQLVIAAQHRSQPLAVAFLTTVGFLQPGIEIEDPVAFIQQHAAQMPHYRSVHLQTQPPGWPVAFWAAREGWERFPAAAESAGHWLLRYDCFSTDLRGLTPSQIAAATLQMSILLISSLGVLPLYGLGRDLFSPAVARLALVVYPLLPGFLVFQSRFDVLYAVVAITAVWLAQRFISKRHWFDVLLLAALLAGITFFSIGPLTTLLLINAYLALYLWIGNRLRRDFWLLVVVNGAVLLALTLFWGGLWLLWGVSWPQIVATGRELHHELRLGYPAWGLFNLYDFGVFFGLPLFVFAISGGIGAARRLLRHAAEPGDALILGWWLFLLALNLSGEVRAETGRLWLFLAVPGLLVGVAALLRPLPSPPARRPLVFLVLVAFALQAAVTGYFLGGRVSAATVPEARWLLPAAATRTHYQLGDTIALQGYTVEPHDNELAVTLYWRALTWTRADYLAFVHALDGNGNLLAQSDQTPAAGALPTWCWVPGEVVEDVHTLPGDEEPVHLGVGLYDWRTGERLPVMPLAVDQVIVLPAE